MLLRLMSTHMLSLYSLFDRLKSPRGGEKTRFYNQPLSFSSWLSFFPLLHLSGREVSMVWMRGVSTVGGLRPRWTPAKSSTIHVFENIRVYIEYSHCQFRIYGLEVSLWHIEELQVLPEVLLVHWTCPRDNYLADFRTLVHMSSWDMKTSLGHSRHHLASGMCTRVRGWTFVCKEGRNSLVVHVLIGVWHMKTCVNKEAWSHMVTRPGWRAFHGCRST